MPNGEGKALALLADLLLIQSWMWLTLQQGHIAVVHQDPQVLFSKAPFLTTIPQPVLLHGVIPTEVQDFVFACPELQGSCQPMSPTCLSSSQ